MPRKPTRPSRKPRSAAAPPVRQLWHPDVPGPLWNGTRRVPRRQIEAYCRVVARTLGKISPFSNVKIEVLSQGEAVYEA